MPYYLYKLLGGLADPLNLFAVLLLLTAFGVVSSWERGQKIAKPVLVLLALALFMPMVLPLGQWALLPLENRYPLHYPQKVDGIIMLTGDENAFLSEKRGEPIAGNAAQRHLAIARLARHYPQAKIVSVGDPTPFFKSKKTSVKTVVSENFNAAGVASERVTYETKSRTTHENALYTKELIAPHKDETWLLVTSAFHLPRAVLCFEKEGWPVIPFPSDYLLPPEAERPHTLDLAHQIHYLALALHEYLGLVSYWAMGWVERPWR